MLAQAPLSASPELHAGIQSRLAGVVALAREVLGERLRTVLLGGSVARGRAFGVREAGRLRLLSDLDLYFVTEPECEAAPLRGRIAAWVAADDFFVSPADVAVVGRAYFASASAALPAHQLAHAHRVLFGEPVEITARRTAAGRPRVDPQDAAELLFNRCIEALDPRLEDPESLPALLHRTKQFIDAPMAWLAAHDRYSPDRRDQLRELSALAAPWGRQARARLEEALAHWSAILDARDAGLIDRPRLRLLAGVAEPGRAPQLQWADWTGGFARSLLGGDGLETLAASLESSLDRTALERCARHWLRREPLPARLRRARRWCSVAPAGVSPWWRHGRGGCGPDRIFAAATLCLHGAPGWAEPLADLIGESPQRPDRLHALWWRWIQGRDDEA